MVKLRHFIRIFFDSVPRNRLFFRDDHSASFLGQEFPFAFRHSGHVPLISQFCGFRVGHFVV